MLLQFRGREEELVTTLRTMRASTNSEDSTMDYDYMRASLTSNQEDDSIVFESDKEASTVGRTSYLDEYSGSSQCSSDSGNIGE